MGIEDIKKRDKRKVIHVDAKTMRPHEILELIKFNPDIKFVIVYDTKYDNNVFVKNTLFNL